MIPTPDTVNPALTRVRNTANTYGRLLTLLRPELPSSPRILDYGAGFGHGSELFLKHYPSVYAYDPMPPLEVPPNVPFLNRDTVDAATFDLIVAVYVLNVLPPDERRDVVLHIADRLSPGGLAAFVVRSWHADIAATKTAIPAPERHAVYVPRRTGTYTYQRGYDGLDLPLEIDWYTTGREDLYPSRPLQAIGSSSVATIRKKEET